MKKFFILAMLLSFTLSFSQEQNHEIFHFWDMDKYGLYHIPGEGGWHDMDFKCTPVDSFRNYYWKLKIGNSSASYSSDRLLLYNYPTIKPTWESPGENTITSDGNQIMLPFGFEPSYFEIYFYNAVGVMQSGLEIGVKEVESINHNNDYLYDDFNYYKSEIVSFSGNMDEQTGNINLSTKILQPDMFYLTVLVNNQPYPTIQNRYFEFQANSWEIEKPLDYLNENLYIDYAWLGVNHHIGAQTKIELILDSEIWGDNEGVIEWYTQQNSDNHIIYIDNRPIAPTISMSGDLGDNPTLTFSGGGANVDHYILKKEYDFNDGTNGIHYVDPAISQYSDSNVEITRFTGDLVARYSVCAVDIYENEFDYSNTVSTDGQSLWKNIDEENINEEVINEYVLNSNYPNPFNPTTQISYQIPKSSFVNLIVYNSLGQNVGQLVNQRQTRGTYSVQFDANNLPSGVYVFKITAGEFSSVKKMILTK